MVFILRITHYYHRMLRNTQLALRARTQVLTPSLEEEIKEERTHFCKLFSNQCEPQLVIYDFDDRTLPKVSVPSLRDYCMKEISYDDDDATSPRHSSGESTIQDALDGRDSFRAWTNGIELYIDNGRVHRRVTSRHRFLFENVTEMESWMEAGVPKMCSTFGEFLTLRVKSAVYLAWPLPQCCGALTIR